MGGTTKHIGDVLLVSLPCDCNIVEVELKQVTVKCEYTENADFQATLNLFQRGQTLMEANVNQ